MTHKWSQWPISIIDSFAYLNLFENHNYNQLSRYIKDTDIIILFGISDSYQRVQAHSDWNHFFPPVSRKASPGLFPKFYQKTTLNRGFEVFCWRKCTLGVVDLLICVMLLSVCFQWVKCSCVFVRPRLPSREDQDTYHQQVAAERLLHVQQNLQ